MHNPLSITVAADVGEKSLAAVGWVRCEVRRVGSWRQREEPTPQTPIYQNTAEDDNPPPEAGILLDHSWSESPASAWDTVGIYLGHGLVAVVKTSTPPDR